MDVHRRLRPGGIVRFRADGDVVRLCDIEADGFKVYLRVYDYTASKVMYTLSVGGNGNCVETRASYGGRNNLRERNMFEFVIWLDKADHPADFHDTAYWRNVN